MDSIEEMTVVKKSNVIENCCISRISDISEARSRSRSSLLPRTPESRDALLVLDSSLTRLDKMDQLNTASNAGIGDDSPHTPKEDVFDPFAPGSEDLLRAPQCKKQFDEWRMSVARRLDFGSSGKKSGKRLHESGNETHMSDEDMVECIYESLLETILENKVEDILVEMSSVSWPDEDCKTPTSAPKLSGIARTCPGAPLKAAPKSRNIDLSLRRKLNF